MRTAQYQTEYYQANRARIRAAARARWAAMDTNKRELVLARMRATTKRHEAEGAERRRIRRAWQLQAAAENTA